MLKRLLGDCIISSARKHSKLERSDRVVYINSYVQYRKAADKCRQADKRKKKEKKRNGRRTKVRMEEINEPHVFFKRNMFSISQGIWEY